MVPLQHLTFCTGIAIFVYCNIVTPSYGTLKGRGMDQIQRVANAPNLAEAIADHLAELIYAAELKPGQYLRQEQLASRLGVSRVPVRDALHIVERRGLAVPVPRRGMMVRPISRKTLRDLYGLRRALEPFAVNEAGAEALSEGAEDLQGVFQEQRDAMDRGDLAGFIAIDEHFHRTLCSLAGNQTLDEAITGVWARIKQIRSVARVDPDWGQSWMARSVERHQELLSILDAADAATAAGMVESSISDAQYELEEELDSLGWLEEDHDKLAESSGA